MKLKSTVNHGHHFMVGRKRLVIPAGHIYTVTKDMLAKLEDNAAFNLAIKRGSLELVGTKKKKPKAEKVEEDGLDR